MNKESETFDPNKEFQKATSEYFTNVRNYLANIELELGKTARLDMADPYSARAVYSYVCSLADVVEKEIQNLGKKYQHHLKSLKNVVAHEYD